MFLLTFYKRKQSDGNKSRQQTEEEFDNRKQRSTKITREGTKRFIINANVNYSLSTLFFSEQNGYKNTVIYQGWGVEK